MLIFCAALLLAACGKKELPTYENQGYVFGTLVEISIYGEDEARAAQAANAVMQEFQRLHDLLHAWKPSALSELNAAMAKGESREAPPEVVSLLKGAAAMSQQSGGLFNPAIGGLIKLWGFQADEFQAKRPDPARIAALVAARPTMSDLYFDGNRVGSRNRAVLIDLGGYAKGYALDRAAEILKQQGVHDALINIGGNVLALGSHGDRPWRIAIQHPRKPGPIATLDLNDGEALGTSGDYQRYFMLDGKRYCHLIDPRTGEPAQGVEAVTILTHGDHAGTLSDSPSKPLFIAGPAGWRAAARQMNLSSAMLVDGAGIIHITTEMQKRLKFTDPATRVEAEP